MPKVSATGYIPVTLAERLETYCEETDRSKSEVIAEGVEYVLDQSEAVEA
jgi:predicted DNA-binding protein